MWDIDKIKAYLKENLTESRYIHTLGVIETAKALANINKIDLEKAEIAALAHDVAKNMNIETMRQIIEEHNIKLPYETLKTPELWHSIIAPIIGEEVFQIEDRDILNAMRWHTTGRENMTTLEKIIYMADMIEPKRSFQGVEELRKATFENLDKGFIMALNHTINYLLNKGFCIDVNTIEARNFIILNNK
ncbi:bis(5'-nucleosyl)-tetraphosphatase (symmetrical) YqeK [Clostridium gasigenes]|uniref:bis(5'-nucleosyl)-tetraphosphatase (symmetrical) YqeK n=1 Tax=Clostridium gasigenes TaxID=94869 RepID=UPI001C0BB03B|nr:bis(5'-nucleosyl)-tetraphosphatase (symmetrical) YqeK [Clostridium gasigenes]MBU3136645.1 bis(5'-nucleosyl)-tetraphosphatase (symmetrical) YqeK [Clostridium gasigenes]